MELIYSLPGTAQRSGFRKFFVSRDEGEEESRTFSQKPEGPKGHDADLEPMPTKATSVSTTLDVDHIVDAN